MSDLAHIETEVLVREILSRCEHGIVSYLREGEVGKDKISHYVKWRGNTVTCAGLAQYAAHVAIATYREEAKDLPSPGGEVMTADLLTCMGHGKPCGENFTADESVGSELALCQMCWESYCAEEFWKAVTASPLPPDSPSDGTGTGDTRC